MTISKLPLGPSAHFRLTSVFLSKEINGHGNPTSHAPELVLSNMATPLGLSIGRLLGAMFPPLPQIQGRQVVAVHNQRDYIFLRRYRYMFAVRGDTELDQERAKERGMDPTVRTRMQEIGPRLTLKLRWLKRGTLETGRRKGGGNVTGAHLQKQAAEDKADAEVAEYNPEAAQADGGAAPDDDAEPAPVDESAEASAPIETRAPTVKPAKRKKARTHTSKGGIRIPRLSIPEASTADARNDFRRKKRKAGDSILEGVFLQGGMKDESLEWQWNVRRVARCFDLTSPAAHVAQQAQALPLDRHDCTVQRQTMVQAFFLSAVALAFLESTGLARALAGLDGPALGRLSSSMSTSSPSKSGFVRLVSGLRPPGGALPLFSMCSSSMACCWSALEGVAQTHERLVPPREQQHVLGLDPLAPSMPARSVETANGRAHLAKASTSVASTSVRAVSLGVESLNGTERDASHRTELRIKLA